MLLRGFDPLADADDYGRELIPAIREKVAALDRDTRTRATAGILN